MDHSIRRQRGNKSLSSMLSVVLGECPSAYVGTQDGRQAGRSFLSFQVGEQACHSPKTEPQLKSMKCHFFFVPIMARGNDSSSVLIWIQLFQQLFQQVRDARSEQNLTHFSVAVAKITNAAVQCTYRQAHIFLTPLQNTQHLSELRNTPSQPRADRGTVQRPLKQGKMSQDPLNKWLSSSPKGVPSSKVGAVRCCQRIAETGEDREGAGAWLRGGHHLHTSTPALAHHTASPRFRRALLCWLECRVLKQTTDL